MKHFIRAIFELGCDVQTAFDFALHLTGAVGHMESEVNGKIGPSLPGIATALKPNSGKGLMALFQLPGMLGHRAKAEAKKEEVIPEESEESEESEETAESAESAEVIQESVTVYKPMISNDSGVVIENDITDSEREDGSGPLKQRTRANSMVKTESSFSLPLNLERTEQRPNSRWKFLKARSLTRPELRLVPPTDKPTMEGLILQAMMILHEAQNHGSSLDLTES